MPHTCRSNNATLERAMWQERFQHNTSRAKHTHVPCMFACSSFSDDSTFKLTNPSKYVMHKRNQLKVACRSHTPNRYGFLENSQRSSLKFLSAINSDSMVRLQFGYVVELCLHLFLFLNELQTNSSHRLDHAEQRIKYSQPVVSIPLISICISSV